MSELCHECGPDLQGSQRLSCMSIAQVQEAQAEQAPLELRTLGPGLRATACRAQGLNTHAEASSRARPVQ